MNSPSPPYSQCDAKGRCIRHPTIQMSRKKKLGGWKKLTAICPMCAMELMSMSNAIINKNNNGNDRVDGVSIPSNDVYCNVVGGNSSPPPPSTSSSPSSSPPLSRSTRSRSRKEPPSDSVSLHSNSSSLRRQRRAPQVGHHDQQNDLGHRDQQDDDRSVDNRSVYSARSAPSAYNNSDNRKHRHQQQHYRQQQQQQQRSPPPQQQRSKQTSNPSASDSSCESTVDMSYESEFSSSATNLNSNNYNSRPGLRRVDSIGSASVFSQSSRGSVRSSTSTHRSPESSAGRRRTNRQRQPPPPPPQQQQQHPHRGHHSPIDAPPIDANNAVSRQNQEQFVCGMELFVDDSRCFYTGQIHMETQLPHGLGTLRSELGHGMSEGQWHFGRLVQESNGGGGGRVAPPPPPPPQANLDVPSLGSPSIYPRDAISSQDCQEDDGMHSPSGYPVEEEEYYQEDDYQEEYHHHQEEYQEEEVEEEHVNYCLPCTSANEEETLCNDLREQCQVEESDAGSETDSQESSYTARESKSHIPPSSSSKASSSPSGRHSSSRSITHHKLQEYKRYIVTCDEEENYYHDEEGRAVYSQEFGGNDYERPMRRVRFQEDP